MANEKRKAPRKTAAKPRVGGFNELPSEAVFLKQIGITKAEYLKTGLVWSDLEKICGDFIALRPAMERQAMAIASILLSKDARDQGVHSVRYRIKEPHSVVEKIIRDRIEHPSRSRITDKNYRNRITDLIGLRVLHTFQYDHSGIHEFLMDTFALKDGQKPRAYYKQGDAEEFTQACTALGCETRKHGKGYRSVHYIISSQLTKELHFAEVQVRTIFQEGWSEIDHKMRYSAKLAASAEYEEDLRNLNGASALADSLATKLKKRHEENRIKRLAATTKPGKWRSPK